MYERRIDPSDHQQMSLKERPNKLVMKAGMDLGSAGPYAILAFGAPRRCDLFGRLSENTWKYPLLWVAPPQQSIFCGSDFGSGIALNLQQKNKDFPTSFSKTNNNAFFSWNL